MIYDRQSGLWLPRERDKLRCDWSPYASLAANPDLYGTGAGDAICAYPYKTNFTSTDNGGPIRQVYDASNSGTGTDNSGDGGFCWRYAIPMTPASKTFGGMSIGGCEQIRCLFRAGSAGFIVDHVSVGILDPNSTTNAFLGLPNELFFNGQSGFNLAAKTFSSSNCIMSDWLNFVISPADTLLINVDINSVGQEGANTPALGADYFYQFWNPGVGYNVLDLGTSSSGKTTSGLVAIWRVDIR